MSDDSRTTGAHSDTLVISFDPDRRDEVEAAITKLQGDKSTRRMAIIDSSEDRDLVRQAHRAKTAAMRAIQIGLEICKDAADEAELRAIADQVQMPEPNRGALTMFAIMRSNPGWTDQRAQPGDLVQVEVPPNCTIHQVQGVDLIRLVGLTRDLSAAWRSSADRRAADERRDVETGERFGTAETAAICGEIADLSKDEP